MSLPAIGEISHEQDYLTLFIDFAPFALDDFCEGIHVFLYDLLRAEFDEQVRPKPNEKGIIDRTGQDVGDEEVHQRPKGE